ncbi:YdcF family protein [uncultured Photobacterium sp.]|uniref:YdcF family protein n=1 Tax=uncultured Photobacterium sp. TaxID=173973 RepID=UPI00263A35EF|nr:YdcF family protein [uncultured Photobacterium sp.]
MIITFLILVITIATAFSLLKWRKTSTTLYTLSALFFLAVGCGFVPAYLLDNLQSPYDKKPTIQWSKQNAIVLLGAGTEKIAQTENIEPGMFSFGRLFESAALYNDCKKSGANCKIIISGGDAKYNGSPEALIYQETLVQLGILKDDIIPEPNSMNTWQNAQFTSTMLRQEKADKVVLVSSGIHLRRSLIYFAHFGINPIAVRADYLDAIPSTLPLSYNIAITDFAVHEYIGIARYHVYNAMGWNPTRTKPGQA